MNGVLRVSGKFTSTCLTPRAIRGTLTIHNNNRVIVRTLFGLPKNESVVETPDDVYCTDRVRKMDNEHYLCGLMFPRSARRHYYALRAFNIELAIIKDVISSSTSSSPSELGAMRLDFWRQVINSCYKNPPNPPPHPIARALAVAISECKLSRQFFKTILDKRERDLTDIQPRTMDELQSYVEGTAGCLNYLSLECLGIKDVKVDHAAVHLGVAEGLATLLRGTAYHAKQRKIYFPVDLTTKHSIIPEKLYNGEIPPSFNDLISLIAYYSQHYAFVDVILVLDVATTAVVHLDKARSFRSSVPARAIPAFLSSVFVDDFLKRLEKVNFNAFDSHLLDKNPFNFWKLLYNNYKGKY